MKEILYKASRMNRYYKLTNFYSFLGSVAVKGGLIMILFILIIWGVNEYVINLEDLLVSFTNHFPGWVVFSSFFLSESLLGILSPEFFIAWCTKLPNPWFSLFILALLSYLGGMVSYIIGIQLYRIPAVKEYVTKKIAKEIIQLKKWGGFLIIVGAMLPLPHSVVSMSCGLIKYKFTTYALWALCRFIRFLIYGIVIFRIIEH